MTRQKIRAIYTNGKLEPLEPLDLDDQQEVTLVIDPAPLPQPSLQQLRAALREALPDLAGRYHVASMELFGSFVRGDATAESDLDILVTFSRTPTLFTVVRLEQELSDLLGVPVDLVLKDSLKPALRSTILADAMPI